MKKLLFIGCNYDQLPYLLEINRKKYQIFGTDINPDAPGVKYCDKFYNIGYDNYKGLKELGIKEGFKADDMVFTASAQFANKGAAYFANEFQIEYPLEKNIDICLNKNLYYKHFDLLGVPIPETKIIKDKKGFLMENKNLDNRFFYYLKSDFSKNPKYVYKFSPKSVNADDIFWGRDRYLRNNYVLQKEFVGEALRINMFGDRFNVFQFEPLKKLNKKKAEIKEHKIDKHLLSFISNLNLNKWLIKFDIIFDGNCFVVLDVGLDPPSRMVELSKNQNINFAKFYIKQYLCNKIEYPLSLD